MKLVNKNDPQVLAIRMPKASAEKFLKALRSGEYKQGKFKLKDAYGGYCCLGVMQQCLTGQVETTSLGGVLGYPTAEWYKMNKITLGTVINTGGEVNIGGLLLPDGSRTTAGSMNDTLGYTFEQIADVFEANMEVY